MAEDLTFKDEAAAEYDRVFAHVTAYFMPFLLRAAHLAPGLRVLDIATGTGLSAEAALAAVGPTGHVTAADLSAAMAEKARERLGKAPNLLVSVEDGQALSFADGSCDAVLCNLGLMFFPDPVRGLSEFRRVLRPGGRAAVSVNTVVERSYNHQINEIIARYRPSLAEAVTRTFALGEASRLRSLFDEAGLANFETDTVRHTFVLPALGSTSAVQSRSHERRVSAMLPIVVEPTRRVFLPFVSGGQAVSERQSQSDFDAPGDGGHW